MNVGAINRSTGAPADPTRVDLPPQDRHARDRIEQVATKLLDLNARLELRIETLEQRMTEYEDALRELGMVQVPNHG